MTGSRTPTEVELKLRLDPKTAQNLMRDPLLQQLKQGRCKTSRLTSVYFDTPDFCLLREKAALRVRQIGKRRIQTLKLAPQTESGVLTRREWESEVDGQAPDLREIGDRHVRKMLGNGGGETLAPIFTTEITRSTLPLRIDGSAIELAVDVGEITTTGGRVPICEAEIELKSGRIESIYKLARELTKRVPLTVEPLTKAERGYALAMKTRPEPRRADPIRLDVGISASDAFQRIARGCLAHLRANDASVRTEASPEAVHQLRVAARRLRSALSAFAPMLDEAERRSAGDCARWIAQQGGSVRDLDVFQAEIVAPLCAQLPGETPLQRLAERAQGARRDAATALIAALDSRAYTERVLALESWIEGEAWRRTANDRCDEPARDFARDVLRRLHRKLTKHGDRIETLDEEGLHTLRIRAKKLRYAAEFFRSLFGDKAAKAYIRALADMQDRLGTLNDGAAARRIVAALAPMDAAVDQAEFARASGAVLGWTACRVSAGLKGLPDAWDSFAKTKTFWK